MSARENPRVRLALPLAATLAVSFLPGSDELLPLSSLAVWLASLYVLGRSRPAGPFSLPFLYLLLLGLFHLGLVVPVSLGVTPPRAALSWLELPSVPAALRLFCVASVAFTIGVLVASRRRQPVRAGEPSVGVLPPNPALFWGGFSCALVGAAILWMGVRELGIFGAAYGDYWNRAASEDVRLLGFGLMLFAVSLLIAAVGATPRRMKIVAVMLLLVIGPLFVIGFRSPAIVHGLALVVVWHRKDPALARRLTLVAAVALIVLAPVIKMTRNLNSDFGEAFKEAQWFDFFLEAGGSFRPLVETVNLIDTGAEPLWLGRSAAIAATRLVPNATFDWKGPRESRTLTPSEWITSTVEPWVYERGGGLGFSAVAEPFLNFGRIGVVVFFPLLGALLARGDHWLTQRPHRAAVAASSFGFLLWTVRNDFTGILRVIALSCAIVLTIRLLGRVRVRRLTSPSISS